MQGPLVLRASTGAGRRRHQAAQNEASTVHTELHRPPALMEDVSICTEGDKNHLGCNGMPPIVIEHVTKRVGIATVVLGMGTNLGDDR